jgi:hypothetical protein
VSPSNNVVERSPAMSAKPAQARALDAPRYVVELCVSPVPIDPLTIPLLDIFDVYRLYCDVGNENGCVRHALRLGFFKDTATAAAVAMYLSSYFDGLRVLELGNLQKARSIHLTFKPLKDIGATGRHAVIELTGERPARAKNPVVSPAVAPAAPRPKAAPRSLLSRILSSP